MDIRKYLDSTYLKTPAQAGLSEKENRNIAEAVVIEAIQESFKLVMVRPDMVAMARTIITAADAKVLVGTVIDFPDGVGSLQDKLAEAQKAIIDGADDLDFVVNYTAFKNGDIKTVKEQVLECTRPGLANGKVVKWIIEIAALTDEQIISICELIKTTVTSSFDAADYSRVFIKSSTGFYKTKGGLPNGATVPAIKLMLEHSAPLPVKAAGGVRNYNEALQMIQLGVMRIGTSSAKAIVQGEAAAEGY
jgi:deoxyribose-phosphate aldolase